MANLGVKVGESRDLAGSNRFFPLPLENHLLPGEEEFLLLFMLLLLLVVLSSASNLAPAPDPVLVPALASTPLFCSYTCAFSCSCFLSCFLLLFLVLHLLLYCSFFTSAPEYAPCPSSFFSSFFRRCFYLQTSYLTGTTATQPTQRSVYWPSRTVTNHHWNKTLLNKLC